MGHSGARSPPRQMVHCRPRVGAVPTGCGRSVRAQVLSCTDCSRARVGVYHRTWAGGTAAPSLLLQPPASRPPSLPVCACPSFPRGPSLLVLPRLLSVPALSALRPHPSAPSPTSPSPRPPRLLKAHSSPHPPFVPGPASLSPPAFSLTCGFGLHRRPQAVLRPAENTGKVQFVF